MKKSSLWFLSLLSLVAVLGMKGYHCSGLTPSDGQQFADDADSQGITMSSVRNRMLAANSRSQGGASSPRVPNKIRILLLDVGTIDTIAKSEKYLPEPEKFNFKQLPTPSSADAMADTELRRDAARINWELGVIEYLQSNEDIRNYNMHRKKVMEAIRASITGNSDNRPVVLAKDLLASALTPYGEWIQLVDRSEATISEIEKSIANREMEEVAPADLFLTVSLFDMKKEETTRPLGNGNVTIAKYSRKATASIRDFSNMRVFTCYVEAMTTKRWTSAVKTNGYDPAEDLIKNAMEQIAEKVGDFFVREYTVKVNIPKGLEEEITEHDCMLYIDRVVKRVKGEDDIVQYGGRHVVAGKPFRALAVEHWVSIVVPNEEFVANQTQTRVGRDKETAFFTIKKLK